MVPMSVRGSALSCGEGADLECLMGWLRGERIPSTSHQLVLYSIDAMKAAKFDALDANAEVVAPSAAAEEAGKGASDSD